MTIKDLADAVAISHNITKKKAVTLINTVWSEMERAIRNGESVKIRGFGTFVPTTRQKRKYYNPVTKELEEQKEVRTVSFVVSPVLKEALMTEEKRW